MENVCPKDIYEKYRNEYGREKTRLSRRSIVLFSFAFFRHCQINRIKRENKTIRFPICRIVAVIQAEITKKNILYQEKVFGF